LGSGKFFQVKISNFSYLTYCNHERLAPPFTPFEVGQTNQQVGSLRPEIPIMDGRWNNMKQLAPG
jgi:hypothetical protein